MKTCPNGHQNPAHYRFCGDCGTLLVVPAVQTASRLSLWLRENRGGRIALLGSVATIVLVLLGVGIVVFNRPESLVAGPGPQPLTAAGDVVRGTFNDWVAAVCPSGQATVGHQLGPKAIQGGICTPASGMPIARSTAVLYDFFNSPYDRQWVLSRAGGVTYWASTTDVDTGALVTFWTRWTDAEVVKPLEAFGFEIQRGPFPR
ncbi:hypothetical protein ASD37_25670 [Mycobacterium sp. Root135]|nr:hypothetical protein ASD37_25670 [Mycobacterium sp. Root135]